MSTRETIPHPEHRQRIQRALAYIAENLHRSLSVAEVARVAHVSEFHFHRIFSAVMQEPVGQFITRQRLETAALMLAYHPWRSVTDVALACGYSSTANFSKAFSAYFGCRPVDVRKPHAAKVSKIGKLASRYGKDFAPADLYPLPEPLDAAGRERRLKKIEESARFEQRDALAVACLSSPSGYDVEAVQRTWRELIARARQLEICGDAVDAYAMVHESPQLAAPELCRYYACVPVARDVALDPPLFHEVIPGGRYAVFRHAGPVIELEQTYRDIYALWFPASSLAPDDFTPVEHYVNDEPNDGVVDMEILIRVRPKAASRSP